MLSKVKLSADDIFKYFSWKNCLLRRQFAWKCQILFFWVQWEKDFKMYSAENFTQSGPITNAADDILIFLTDYFSGPSCSKLTSLLVNDLLKFTLSDTQYAEIFCWKNVSSFCSAKATHIFSAKNIRILCIESAKTVNEMTLNELVKLTMLWTTGPR